MLTDWPINNIFLRDLSAIILTELPPAPFLFYCGLQVIKASDPAITNDPA
jgi:hypothetical protein